MAPCIVSFVNLDGIRHWVEIEAEGLYEAGVLGLCAFRKHNLQLAGFIKLGVEICSSMRHILTVSKISEWLVRRENAKKGVLKEGCERCSQSD